MEENKEPTKLLKKFSTASWYGDYYHHSYVELWGRKGDEYLTVHTHESAVDSSSAYKRNEAEEIYQRLKKRFSELYPNVEQTEEIREEL